MTTAMFDFGEPELGPLDQLLVKRELLGAAMDSHIDALATLYGEVNQLHGEIGRNLSGHAAQSPPDCLGHEKTVSALKARIAAAFAPLSPGGPHNSPFGLASDRTPLTVTFKKQHEHLNATTKERT